MIDRRNGHLRVIGEQTHFDSLDDAKVHAKAVRERANKYGTNTITTGSTSPRGKVQLVENNAPGIDAVYRTAATRSRPHGTGRSTPAGASQPSPRKTAKSRPSTLGALLGSSSAAGGGLVDAISGGAVGLRPSRPLA